MASDWGMCPLDWLTGAPASGNQVEYQDDQRHDQQDVNQPASGERGEHSESPQNYQNYKECPEHVLVPSRCMNASAGPKRQGELNRKPGQPVQCRNGESRWVRVQDVHRKWQLLHVKLINAANYLSEIDASNCAGWARGGQGF